MNLLTSRISNFFVEIYNQASETSLSATVGYCVGVLTFFGVGLVLLAKAIFSMSLTYVFVAGPIATVCSMVAGCVAGWVVSCVMKFFKKND